MTAVVFDGIIFALQRQGGISRYFRELFLRHAARDRRSKLILYGSGGDIQDIPPASTLQQRSRFLERYRKCQTRADGVFHSSYYRLPASNARVVTTVHDFTYERYRKGAARFIHSQQKKYAISQADAVICVSEATKHDLFEMCPGVPESRVTVVPNGVSEIFLKSNSRQISDQPYVLYVGSREAGYKNFGAAVEAIKLLPGLSLIAAGPKATDAEQQLMRETNCKVRFMSVNDETLRKLYEGAVCTLYPSLYEGFGLPLLEAMACRCPVVCLPSPGVLETAGSEAYFASDNNPAAFAESIRLILNRPVDTARLEAAGARAREYTWDRSYEQTVAIYDALGWS
jgi:mannosyltransferase